MTRVQEHWLGLAVGLGFIAFMFAWSVLGAVLGVEQW